MIAAVLVAAVPVWADGGESASGNEESLEEAGNELRFRVIERGGSSGGGSGSGESGESEVRTTGSGEVAVEAIPESLLEPMRQRRWKQAEEALPKAGERSAGGWFAGGWIAWNREQWVVAETRFQEAIEQNAGLPDFSALYAARSAYKADRYHRAAIMAAKVSTASSQYPKALYVLGESLNQLETQTDRRMTVRVMRAYLRHFPRGPDADRVRLVLGDALAAQEQYRSAGKQWEEVLRNHPTSQWAEVAHKRFEAHRSSLPEPYDGYAESLPRELQMARWEGMYANHASEALVAEVQQRIDGWTKGTRDRCQALYWLARSLTKLRRHGDAISWYDQVLTECEGLSPFERNALYMMGKSQWNAGRLDEALGSFEKLRTRYASHSFADDVMYFAARIHRERGDRAEMRQRLEAQLERYPRGDMAPDARWLLLRGEFAAQDWEGIVQRIDRWRENDGRLGSDQYAAGRLSYAKARALVELGRVDEAREDYRAVASTHPLSYYALLALNRLADLNERDASSTSAVDAGAPPSRIGGDGSGADAGTKTDSVGDTLCEHALREMCAELVETGRSVRFSGRLAGADGSEQRESEVGAEKVLDLPRRVTTSRIFETGHRLLAYGAAELAAEQFRELFEIHGGDTDALWGLARLLGKAEAYSLSHHIARRKLDGWKRAYPAGSYAEMWEIAYPRPFAEMVGRWSGRRALSSSLVWGLMREESGFSPAIGSWAGAVGLMQLMPDTAETTARRLATSGEKVEIPSRSDLTDPAINVQIGTGYLAGLGEQLGGRPALMVAGYNAGLGNVSRWLDDRGGLPLDLWVEDIPYGQTRHYVKRVMSSYFTYTWLQAEGGAVPHVAFELE